MEQDSAVSVGVDMTGAAKMQRFGETTDCKGSYAFKPGEKGQHPRRHMKPLGLSKMNPKLKTYTVRTTSEDIREWQGETSATRRRITLRCPVERFFDHHGNPEVVVSSAYIGIAGNECELPERVKRWLAHLDSGKPVRPITFKIKLPV